MKKQFNLLLIGLFTIILTTPALAIWKDEPQDRFLSEQQSTFYKGYNVKINNVNYESLTAQATIKKEGKVVYQGLITTTEGFTKKGDVKIKAESFRKESPIEPQVKLDTSFWTDIKIENINFPHAIYHLGAYKTFAILQNTGKHQTTYDITLGVKGKANVKTSDESKSTNFQSSFRQTSKKATHTITLDSGESKKIYYELQSTGQDRLKTEVKPIFNLSTGNGQLIKQEKLNPIPIVNRQVGYIQDMKIKDQLFSGKESTIQVEVKNSWMVGSDNYYLKLSSPEFKINRDTKQLQIGSGETEQANFLVLPYGGGKFPISAELSIGQKTEDEFTLETSVGGEKVYKIQKVEAPTYMEEGEKDIVFVTIKNNGRNTNRISLTLNSDDFNIQSKEAIIQLGAGQETRAMFNIESINDKKFKTLTVNLYDFRSREYRRYVDKKIVDTQEITIREPEKQTEPEETTPQQDEETTDEETTIEENVTQEPGETDMEQETNATEKPPEKQAISMKDLKGLWPYIAIAVLVLLAILLIILGERKESKENTDVQVYDLEDEDNNF